MKQHTKTKPKKHVKSRKTHMEENKTDQTPQKPDAETKRFNRIWKSATPLIIVGVLLLGAAGFVGYAVWQKRGANAGGESGLGRERLSGVLGIDDITVQLGPEERIAGPSGDIDTPYFMEKDAAGVLKGYSGNTRSLVFDIGADGTLGKSRTILEKGPHRANFDGCGAWLLGSIYKGAEKNDRIGWYHAETDCAYDNDGQTLMSIAFAESKDGGKTWAKPNYPNNRTITADARLQALAVANKTKPDAHKIDDVGNGKVIKRGEYYYAFFGASTYHTTFEQVLAAGDKLHVARSNVKYHGKPGTWFKWYCTDPSQPETCKWSEKGIGGKSTAIPGSDGKSRFITWNTYLNRYIAIRANGKQGFTLRASQGANILSWAPKRETLYPEVTYKNDPEVNDWGYGEPNRNGKRQLYAYASIVSISGIDNNKDGSVSDETGQQFYLYYVKLYAGHEFDQRNLLRRKVTLLNNHGLSRVQLTAYKNDAGQLRMTTELPKAAQGYHIREKASAIGYLATFSAPGYVPLFECQLPGAKEFYLLRDNTPENAPYQTSDGKDDWSRCSDEYDLVRRVGWIATEPTGEATAPLYRCYSKTRQDRFVSGRADCNGATQRGIIGYMLPPLR